jgi:tetratricopeptide (TPR) repeat protein
LKALELDDSVVEAHVSLAEVKKGYDWNWSAAEAYYRRAIELSQSYSLAHAGYSDYLSKMCRHDEAVAEAMRASELDPLSAGNIDNLARILYRARRYDDAIRASQRAQSLDGKNPIVLWTSGLIYEQKREFREAIGRLEGAVALSPAPPFRAALGHVYAVAGERVKAMALLQDLVKHSRQGYVSPLDIAMVHAGLGNKDSAFEWLEKAYRERSMRLQELPDPVFDGLRSDRRFGELMKRVGLPR